MIFASENFDTVHPAVMKALANINKGFVPSYGKDDSTEALTKKFKNIFKREDISVHLCFNGTGANNFALAAITDKSNSIFCSDISHVYTAESTAPEALSGCRLFPVLSAEGKINIEDLLSKINNSHSIHFPEPAVLSISQPTEYGTIYNKAELKQIAAVCRKHHLLLHIDGARIFNAIEGLQCSLANIQTWSNADVITIGGTKNGLMFGEAVVFFRPNRFKRTLSHHKRSMQLASKNRFIAAQFNSLLANDLGRKIAAHSNSLAAVFQKEINKITPGVIMCPAETNMVFIRIHPGLAERLGKISRFYSWDKANNIFRFVFSNSNTHKEVLRFINYYRRLNLSEQL